jgi:hypothetical protein
MPERSELFLFPAFAFMAAETQEAPIQSMLPAGSACAVAFFGLPFLATQKR